MRTRVGVSNVSLAKHAIPFVVVTSSKFEGNYGFVDIEGVEEIRSCKT